MPSDCKYVRIVITPVWPEDVKKDEQVVKWYDLITQVYSKQLNVKVLHQEDLETIEPEESSTEPVLFNMKNYVLN